MQEFTSTRHLVYRKVKESLGFQKQGKWILFHNRETEADKAKMSDKAETQVFLYRFCDATISSNSLMCYQGAPNTT